MKQEFERKNLKLGKRIAKLEEEKMYLSLDIDVQKMEVEKERKEKRKIEEDRDDLKEHYKKAQVSLRRAKIGGSSDQLQKKVQEEKARAEYWEKKFQEMQSRNLALEEENKELKSKVTELRRSLRWHRNQDPTVELKELKIKVEDLEAALQEGKLQIEQLEMQGNYLKGKLHQSRGQIRERDHVMEEAIAQIRDVAEYVQDLAVRADVLSRKEKLEITHPYGTRTKNKNMDQRFEQLQKDMQDQLQEQLAKMQNEMREQMMEA
ncbi:tropomyosin-1-like [Gossypium arboreum]|uniref:tropomyosin-1-like n=1 Tax=Gossypium arboreum TaxID=29729 RepID=UPI0008196453|nr:tropomyosin-1-like [Gossypium arboreum]